MVLAPPHTDGNGKRIAISEMRKSSFLRVDVDYSLYRRHIECFWGVFLPSRDIPTLLSGFETVAHLLFVQFTRGKASSVERCGAE